MKEAPLVSESQNVSNCSVWCEDEEGERVGRCLCSRPFGSVCSTQVLHAGSAHTPPLP